MLKLQLNNMSDNIDKLSNAEYTLVRVLEGLRDIATSNIQFTPVCDNDTSDDDSDYPEYVGTDDGSTIFDPDTMHLITKDTIANLKIPGVLNFGEKMHSEWDNPNLDYGSMYHYWYKTRRCFELFEKFDKLLYIRVYDTEEWVDGLMATLNRDDCDGYAGHATSPYESDSD